MRSGYYRSRYGTKWHRGSRNEANWSATYRTGRSLQNEMIWSVSDAADTESRDVAPPSATDPRRELLGLAVATARDQELHSQPALRNRSDNGAAETEVV